MMSGKLTYEELEQRVQELEQAEHEYQKIEKELRESEARYRLITDNVTDVIWVLDPESQTFKYVSPSIKNVLGLTDKECLNRSLAQFVTPTSLEFIQQTTPIRIERMLQGDNRYYTDEIETLHKDGHIVHTEIHMHFVKNQLTGLIESTGVMRDITQRKLFEHEREKLIQELQSALTEIKTLTGLLPICSHCKKIRDDKGYWNQLETYIGKHSEAEFSHSICQDCLEEYYPDIDDE